MLARIRVHSGLKMNFRYFFSVVFSPRVECHANTFRLQTHCVVWCPRGQASGHSAWLVLARSVHMLRTKAQSQRKMVTNSNRFERSESATIRKQKVNFNILSNRMRAIIANGVPLIKGTNHTMRYYNMRLIHNGCLLFWPRFVSFPACLDYVGVQLCSGHLIAWKFCHQHSSTRIFLHPYQSHKHLQCSTATANQTELNNNGICALNEMTKSTGSRRFGETTDGSF